MAPASSDLAPNLQSFKSIWSAFARQTEELLGRTRLEPQDEATFLENKVRVIERYERLREETSESMPPEFQASIRYLAGVHGIISLSDAEHKELEASVAAADRELTAWIDKAERRDIFRETAETRARKQGLKVFVVVPLFFTALVVLFVYFGLKFFLNR